jgi:hypothetical protein
VRRSHVPALLTVLVLLAILPLSHNLRRSGEALRPRHELADRILYLPSGDGLRPACLGFDAVVSDLLWIRAILFFGGHHAASAGDAWNVWLYYMLDLVTDLNPHATAPYKYGGVMLRISPDWIDASNLIMAKGMAHNPDDWYFPFSIAMNYHLLEDMERAAEFLLIAAALPDAPFYLPNLAASLLNETDQEEVALHFLLEEYKTAPGEMEKNAIYVKIHETRFMIARRDVDAARTRFEEEVGHPPTDLTELVPTYLATLPDDPWATFVEDGARCTLTINPLDNEVMSTCMRKALTTIQTRYGIGSLQSIR